MIQQLTNLLSPQAFALSVLAFLLGSIPSGFILGKLYGVDIRQHGSKNIGATNASRVLGPKVGMLTLLFDMLKGILAIMLAHLFPNINSLDSGLPALLGLVALFGHCYSPFLNFKGGKGVATGGGVFLTLAPIQAATAIVVFFISLKITKYVSLSSILAALSLPVLLFLSSNPNDNFLALFAAVASCLIIYRHNQNISRLRQGTEPQFRSKTT